MAENERNCSESVENDTEMSKERLIPGGYITKQLIDEIAMASNESNRDLEAVTRISADPHEMYRVIARLAVQNGIIHKAINDLRKIFE